MKSKKSDLKSIGPFKNGFRLSEDLNRQCLWYVGVGGTLLIVLAILLNILWEVKNIFPNVALSLGTGAILFAVFFLLERRIIRQTGIYWVSAMEDLAAQVGQSSDMLAAHFYGPVAVVNNFIDAIFDEDDYQHAWKLTDQNWRLCRAQAWLWNNKDHPTVLKYDYDTTAEALAEENSVHELWEYFGNTELKQFRESWSNPDIRKYGAASAKRKVEDDEIVILTNLYEYPSGFIIQKEKIIDDNFIFLVHKIKDNWFIANMLGDHIPEPGWPPDWKEGWTYWDKFNLKKKIQDQT
jgi:hypothetical protein